MRSRFLAAVLASGVAPWVKAQAAPLRFVYPNTHDLGEAAFGSRALRLALEQWGLPFELRLVEPGWSAAMRAIPARHVLHP